jgi:hypothetical protein
MTFGEAKGILGYSRTVEPYTRGGVSKGVIVTAQQAEQATREAQARWDKAHEEVILGPKVFLCGDLKMEICQDPGCDFESEILCDWPIGDGRTCDLRLCATHARNMGEDRDFCPVHFAMWVESTRSERLAKWPPPSLKTLPGGRRR